MLAGEVRNDVLEKFKEMAGPAKRHSRNDFPKLKSGNAKETSPRQRGFFS